MKDSLLQGNGGGDEPQERTTNQEESLLERRKNANSQNDRDGDKNPADDRELLRGGSRDTRIVAEGMETAEEEEEKNWSQE
ncbi:hypothetical protein NDU88_008003 [Pleurodeles waltl]|uniref:Uncharacterized protein n=1 Tax=Pleurodeles waltl TaxID=8319 RepID=A0AAV7PQM6_PLEWA|nr:hypothetical protein NDU88_008003 [Pleurodeles waltl]